MNPCPATLALAQRLGAIRSDRLADALDFAAEVACGQDYPNRTDLANRALPPGLDADEAWTAIKLGRLALRRDLDLADPDGAPLGLSAPVAVQRSLHQLDRGRDLPAAASPAVEAASRPAQGRFAVKARWAEAVATTQLAGAAIDPVAGVEFLRQSREPEDDHERLLANAEAALTLARSWSGVPFSPARVIELQRGFVQGATAPANAADETDLPQRLAPLCRFLNAEDGGPFLHPLERAVGGHYWLLRHRPFAVANGRTARALVDWAMARAGYPLFGMLAPSRELAAAPADYAAAVERAAADDGDVTHFVAHQLRAVEQAIAVWRMELSRAEAEVRTIAASSSAPAGLNSRQLALLAHAVRHPDARYGIEAHRRSHGITFPTASADLFDLAERGLLAVAKAGRTHVFTQAKVEMKSPAASGRPRRVRRPAPPAELDESDDALPVNLL